MIQQGDVAQFSTWRKGGFAKGLCPYFQGILLLCRQQNQISLAEFPSRVFTQY